jgi:ubiquinone/menaquinone biosynthesis C-methylase UbiE
MPAKLDLEQIRDFWTRQAREHGESPSVSWSDRMIIEMEIREILNRLSDGDRILDVGCATGFSTVQFAAQRKAQVRGVDYIPEMIEQARQRLSDLQGRLQGTVDFSQGDVTALAEPGETYDKVVAIRVIINLCDWTQQLQGLQECSRVLKRGGIFLLSEALGRLGDQMGIEIRPETHAGFEQQLARQRSAMNFSAPAGCLRWYKTP